MPNSRIFNVLFLCTGNSARSIFAEAYTNAKHRDRFQAFSAGSHPKAEIHPLTLEYLKDVRIPTDGLRTKSWNEFAGPDAPVMDFVFTVCDQAAGEVCPVWPGQPITAHWGVPDPASIEGTPEVCRTAFHRSFLQLERRISLFAALPIDSLDRMTLTKRVQEIGRSN